MQSLTGFASHREISFSVCIIDRPTYGGKSCLPCNDNIVLTTGAVNNQDVSVFIPAAHNADMGI